MKSKYSRLISAGLIQKSARDIFNRIAYGKHAPKSDSCIYINPNEVKFAYNSENNTAVSLSRRKSGKVLGGDWDKNIVPLWDNPKYPAVYDHFVNGKSWRETGILDYVEGKVESRGGYDGCWNKSDILQRYEDLDKLYYEIKMSGRLKTRKELGMELRGEHGGIYIHIARDGTLIKGVGGAHRLAICQALKLTAIPVHLGVVHIEAVRRKCLKKLYEKV